MALYEFKKEHGIQKGKELDKCFMCEKHAYSKKENLSYGLLNNKDVFVLHLHGNRVCICMDCFKTMLGEYELINPTEAIDVKLPEGTEIKLSAEEEVKDDKKSKSSKR